MSDFKCKNDDCAGFACAYHGLSDEAQQYIDKLEQELAEYKEHFEPQMFQIRLQKQAQIAQEKAYAILNPGYKYRVTDASDEKENG